MGDKAVKREAFLDGGNISLQGGIPLWICPNILCDFRKASPTKDDCPKCKLRLVRAVYKIGDPTITPERRWHAGKWLDS